VILLSIFRKGQKDTTLPASASSPYKVNLNGAASVIITLSEGKYLGEQLCSKIYSLYEDSLNIRTPFPLGHEWIGARRNWNGGKVSQWIVRAAMGYNLIDIKTNGEKSDGDSKIVSIEVMENDITLKECKTSVIVQTAFDLSKHFDMPVEIVHVGPLSDRMRFEINHQEGLQEVSSRYTSLLASRGIEEVTSSKLRHDFL